MTERDDAFEPEHEHLLDNEGPDVEPIEENNLAEQADGEFDESEDAEDAEDDEDDEKEGEADQDEEEFEEDDLHLDEEEEDDYEQSVQEGWEHNIEKWNDL